MPVYSGSIAETPPLEAAATALRPGPSRIVGNALVASIAQLASMGLGAILALVILLEFGKTGSTDGVLAAYGVYGLLLMVAHSLRTTVVARLLEDGILDESFDRFLGTIALLIVLAAGPLVLLREPVATALVGASAGPAHDATATGLPLLWLAAGAQLIAGLSAAALATRQEFVVPSIAYVAGGIPSIVGVIAFAGWLGTDAVAVSVAAGAALAAAIMLWRLRTLGHRSSAKRILTRAGTGSRLRVIVAGSSLYLGMQLMFVISLAFAARMGEGEVTLYTYSYFAATLVVGMTSGSVAMVMAAPISQTWDRRPESLQPHLKAIVGTGLTVILPLLAFAAVAGDEIVELLLGAVLDARDAGHVAAGFVALGGHLVGMLAIAVPLVAAFAAGRHTRVAAVMTAAALAHVGLTAVAGRFERIEAIAVAATVSTLIAFVLLSSIVFGGRTPAALAIVAREVAVIAAVVLVAFALPAGVSLSVGATGDFLAGLGGLVLFAVATRRLLPGHWELLGRLTAPFAARLQRVG